MATKYVEFRHPTWVNNRIAPFAATITDGMIEDGWSLDSAVAEGFTVTPLLLATPERIEAMNVMVVAGETLASIGALPRRSNETYGDQKSLQQLDDALNVLRAILTEMRGGNDGD